MKCFIQILLHLSQLISGGAEPSVVEGGGGLLPGYLNSIQFYLYWAKCHDTFHVGQVYTIHPFWSRSQLSLGEASLDRTLYNNNPHRDLFISDTLHGSKCSVFPLSCKMQNVNYLQLLCSIIVLNTFLSETLERSPLLFDTVNLSLLLLKMIYEDTLRPSAYSELFALCLYCSLQNNAK